MHPTVSKSGCLCNKQVSAYAAKRVDDCCKTLPHGVSAGAQTCRPLLNLADVNAEWTEVDLVQRRGIGGAGGFEQRGDFAAGAGDGEAHGLRFGGEVDGNYYRGSPRGLADPPQP